jgi:DNA-binding MarR family transcriptional regulator
MPFDEFFEAPGQFEFGFLVHDVSRLRRTVFDNALKPLAITRSQWWVLAHLSRHRPMSTTDLAKILDIGGVALGRLLDRMEAKNYIIRRRVAHDRRIKLVDMTPQGESLLRLMQEHTLNLNEDMMTGMNNADIARVEDILHRMKVRLQEMNVESRLEKSTGKQV